MPYPRDKGGGIAPGVGVGAGRWDGPGDQGGGMALGTWEKGLPPGGMQAGGVARGTREEGWRGSAKRSKL